jgi:hypothetical protein
MVKILKDIKVKECLFDDFMRYEEDEARIKQHRWSKLSHNAPDFVPVSQRRRDASEAPQPKLGSVLIDRTSEIQNVSDKPQECNGTKHQDPCADAAEKQVGGEAGKENGHLESRCTGKQGNEKAPKPVASQPQTSTLKTSLDGKQQYWKKVEPPRVNPDGAAVQGSSKVAEKHVNGVNASSAVVALETPDEETISTKVGSLTISGKARKADDESRLVDVVTIGSLPIRVSKSVE